MTRMLRSLVAGGFALVGAAVLAPGCADNNSTLFITGVIYDKPPGCTVSADPASLYLGSGTLDLAFRKNYQAWMLVGNQLTSRGSKQTLRSETSRVNLTGAEIDLTDSLNNRIKKFSVHGSGFVDVSRGEDPGWGLFGADLIPSTVGETLAGRVGTGATVLEVIATVRVFGSTLGNQDVTSAELSYPIRVCYGCLVQYPLVAVDFVTDPANPTCSSSATELPITGCRPGQDDYIDCRSCAATHDICNSVPAQAPM